MPDIVETLTKMIPVRELQTISLGPSTSSNQWVNWKRKLLKLKTLLKSFAFELMVAAYPLKNVAAFHLKYLPSKSGQMGLHLCVSQ
ncbi:hypothetical protein D3C85_1580580 [compost metagenome]